MPDVVVKNWGSDRLKATIAVSKAYGVDLKEAKHRLDDMSFPHTFKSDISRAEAENIARDLLANGAVAEAVGYDEE
ncbi:hypothetical protein DFJ74DRAFT_665399 [Hyaloraphidium curvatum]|nr:hypothetical protein DFJ74DRAFT_665399 [Hyaloraphidium curvatum]